MVDRTKNTEAIFLAALEKPTPEGRVAYAEGACSDDPTLLARVKELLAAHEDNDGPLDSPPSGVGVAATIDHPVAEKPGTVIGPYKLLQKLGEGGMGVVYMAEQSEPVKRRVALKVIKPGMDTGQVIARFEAERQALALMDHPGIAKVFDAGATESGRPYFVMELVKGIPLTQYCDEQHFTPKQRLELFIQVCQAVQHAHQKGIIHRDLKPTNVLVAEYDQQAVPKIIDFGVAKATSQQLTEKTMFTQYGQIVGTLEYMSPEQAKLNQLDIDTRSDIYSLGVLLYELLVGTTPFERDRLRSAAFEEMLRIIREEEPPKPSLRLSTIETLRSVAAQRRTEPRKLSTLVRGELDWIVMKALEKDRARRYDTANGFADDIQHYLNDEAVLACPPSAAYRFRKFARRNKAPLATVGVIVVALVSGVVVSTWQWGLAEQARKGEAKQRELAEQAEKQTRIEANRANTEAQRAEVEAERAKSEAAISRAVNDFVNNDLLEFADPEQEPDRNIPLRRVLDRASEEIEQFESAPLVEAAIRHTLGKTYLSLGEYKTAEPHLKQAVDIRQELLGKEHRDTLRSMHLLTQVYHKQALFKKADELNKETYLLRLEHLGQEDPDTLESISSSVALHISLGRYFEAEDLCQRTLELKRRKLGERAESTLRSQVQLAEVLHVLARYPEAEQLCIDTIASMHEALGAEHPQALAIRFRLAKVYLSMGRYKEAEDIQKKVIEIKTRVLGPEHPDTLSSISGLVWVYGNQSDYPKGYAVAEQVLRARQRVLGPEHRDTVSSMLDLAGLYAFWRGRDDSDDRIEEVFRIRKRVLGPEHPDTIVALSSFAFVTSQLGNTDKGAELQELALELYRRVLGKEHPKTLDCMMHLAFQYHGLGLIDESEELYRRAVDGERRVLGEHHRKPAKTLHLFAGLYEGQGRLNDAQQLLEKAIEIEQNAVGENHVGPLNKRAHLAALQGQHGTELKLRKQILENRLQAFGEQSYVTHDAIRNLAKCHRQQGNYQQAEKLLSRVLKLQEGAAHERSLTRTWNEFAALRRALQRYGEAQDFYQKSLDYWLREQGPNHQETLATLAAMNDLAADCFSNDRRDFADELWRRVLEVQPHDTEAACNLGASLLLANDIEGYRSHSLNFLNQHHQATDSDVAAVVASCFALHPWPSSELEQPLRLAQLAVDQAAKPEASRLNSLGALLYRTGSFQKALEALNDAVEARRVNEDASDWFWLSMVHQAFNNAQEARRYYDRGVAWLEKNPNTPAVKVLQNEAVRRLSDQ